MDEDCGEVTRHWFPENIVLHFVLLTAAHLSQRPKVGSDVFPRSWSETVARMDAGAKPTGTYLRRVSDQDLGNMSEPSAAVR